MQISDAELAAEIRRHAAIFDTTRQAVIGTTLPGRIVYWNATAERIYGWRAEEVVGRMILDVAPTDSSRAQAEAIMARLREGRSWSGEFRVQGRDGEEFDVLVHDMAVKDGAGRLVGLVGVSSRC